MAKVAIVTGASRGIGREIAKRLAADGFSVVVNYSGNAAKAEEVATEIKGAGGTAITVKANVGNEEDVTFLFEHTRATFGQIDVLVHSAGIMLLSPIIKNDVEQFDNVISTNLRGTFLVFAKSAQHMTDGGRIVVLSSSVLAKSFPSYGHTSHQKPALKGWFECSQTSCVAGTSPSMLFPPVPSRRSSFFRTKPRNRLLNSVRSLLWSGSVSRSI